MFDGDLTFRWNCCWVISCQRQQITIPENKQNNAVKYSVSRHDVLKSSPGCVKRELACHAASELLAVCCHIHSSWCACNAWHCVVQRRYRVVALRHCTSSTRRTRSVSSHTCSVHWQMPPAEWLTATRPAGRRRAALFAGYSRHTRLANKSCRSTCRVSISHSTMHCTIRLVSYLLSIALVYCYLMPPPFQMETLCFRIARPSVQCECIFLCVQAEAFSDRLTVAFYLLHLVLWYCWLGDWNGIQPTKNLCYIQNSWRRDFCLQCFDAVGWAAGRASGL